jgi:uncharacterized membrane protein (DUF4010 family)
MGFLNAFPPLLVEFAMTVAFSFVVGLEFHSYQQVNQYQYRFGSTRTYVLISVLGFMLYKLDDDKLLFTVGMLLLGMMLLVYYWQQASQGRYSLLSVLLALLTYLIGPVASHFPNWYLVLFVVLLILLLGEKPLIHKLSEKLSAQEMVTLAKFLIMSGVILPLLPDSNIAPFLPVTYHKVWIAVIVVSGFSYISYLAQSYFFMARGLMLTGILGGLYSSTAVTVVISRRAHALQADIQNVSPAIIMATAMMYLRLLAIIYILKREVAGKLLIPFLMFMILSFIAAYVIRLFGKKQFVARKSDNIRHPLELTTALLFAFLFVLFTCITQYVIVNYGGQGLNILSFSIGFTDIDPFILSLLAGEFNVPEMKLVSAIIIASGSNNLLKGVYALMLARNRSVLPAAIWLVFLFAGSMFYALITI